MDGVGEFHIHIVRLPSSHPPFISNKPEPGVGATSLHRVGPPRGGRTPAWVTIARVLHSSPIVCIRSMEAGRLPILTGQQLCPVSHCSRHSGNIKIRCWLCPTLLALVTGLKSGVRGVLLEPTDAVRNTYIPIIYIETRKFYSCFQIVYTS